MLFDIPKYNTRLGTIRAYHLAAIVFISSFLSGYDSGVAGGVLTFKPFMRSFHYTSHQKTRVNSLTVGLSQLGSFLSCMAFYPLAQRFGRKYCIMGSAVVFMVGAILQTVRSGSLACWYVGRVVAGCGQGGLSVVVPIYSAEMTPREIRGRCGSFYQWMFTWGVLISYWVDYGVNKHLSATNPSMWQIPIGLQLLSSGLLFLGTFSLPESTRWLLTRNRADEAWSALSWVRADTGETTVAEFDEIKAGLQAEQLATANITLKELLSPSNRMRFLLGAALFTFQNSTGSSALAVFGPQFFSLLVGSDQQTDLLLTGLFGAVKVIACTFFILVIAERFGRRTLLTGGASLMAACMLVVALLDHYKPPPAKGDVTSAGKAMVALIYLDIMIYNCSWGPLPWAYAPEIFPQRIRSLGMGTSMLAHWLTSFVFSFASPYMIANIGWRTFLIFFALDVVAAVFTFFFVRETRGKGLENASGVQWEVVEKQIDGSSEEGEAGKVEGEKVAGKVVENEGGDGVEVVGVRNEWHRAGR